MDGDYSDKFLDLGVKCLPTNEQPLQGPLQKNISNRVRPFEKAPPPLPLFRDSFSSGPYTGCTFVGTRRPNPGTRQCSRHS